MHNFVTAATNLMVFLIGALSGGDSIAKCHIARVFQHSSIQTPRHNYSVYACNELYAKTEEGGRDISANKNYNL